MCSDDSSWAAGSRLAEVAEATHGLGAPGLLSVALSSGGVGTGKASLCFGVRLACLDQTAAEGDLSKLIWG